MRRGLLLLAGLPLLAALLLGGYGIYWKIVHDRALAILDETVESWRAAGYEVAWSSRTTGGFPLKVEAALESPSIADPAGPEPWRWSAERLRVSLAPWRLDRITLAPEGRHEGATVLGPFEGAAEDLAITLQADALGLRQLVATSGPASLVAQGDGASLVGLTSLSLTIDRDADDPGAYRLVADTTGPQWIAAGAGAPERVSLEAGVTRLDAALSAHEAEAGLAAWAAAGGGLALADLSAEWRDAAISLAGELHLDRQGLWNGEVVLASTAPGRALERLAAVGALEPGMAERTRAVAATLDAEGDASVQLPLTLRRGEIYALGLVKIGRLAPAF